MPPSLLPPDPENWRAIVANIGVMFMLGYLGRLAFHLRMIRAGRRTFWSMHLVYEIPMAVFAGLVGAGVGIYAGLDGLPLYACISVVGYLGPGGVEDLLDRYMKRQEGKDK